MTSNQTATIEIDLSALSDLDIEGATDYRLRTWRKELNMGKIDWPVEDRARLGAELAKRAAAKRAAKREAEGGEADEDAERKGLLEVAAAVIAENTKTSKPKAATKAKAKGGVKSATTRQAGRRRIIGTEFFTEVAERNEAGKVTAVTLHTPDGDKVATLTFHNAKGGRGWHKGTEEFTGEGEAWSTLREAALALAPKAA